MQLASRYHAVPILDKKYEQLDDFRLELHRPFLSAKLESRSVENIGSKSVEQVMYLAAIRTITSCRRYLNASGQRLNQLPAKPKLRCG